VNAYNNVLVSEHIDSNTSQTSQGNVYREVTVILVLYLHLVYVLKCKPIQIIFGRKKFGTKTWQFWHLFVMRR